MGFRWISALAAAVLVASDAVAGATVKSIKAFARPERVYAGQDFEVCYEIMLSEATDMNIYRPTGLPEALQLGAPRIDGSPGAQTTAEGGFARGDAGEERRPA